jgi:hypothetical protein
MPLGGFHKKPHIQWQMPGERVVPANNTIFCHRCYYRNNHILLPLRNSSIDIFLFPGACISSTETTPFPHLKYRFEAPSV